MNTNIYNIESNIYVTNYYHILTKKDMDKYNIGYIIFFTDEDQNIQETFECPHKIFKIENYSKSSFNLKKYLYYCNKIKKYKNANKNILISFYGGYEHIMLFLVFYLTNKEKSYMNIEMAVSLLLNKLIILNTNIPLNIENIKYEIVNSITTIFYNETHI